MTQETQENTQQRLVWIDLEMTGLSVDNDEIVEIAAIVTDAELNELDAGISLVIKPSQEALNNMDDFVTGMHNDSGLMTELDTGITLEAAQTQVLDYIKSHVPEPNKGHLAGSSVYVDRGFLAKYMPDIDQYLHYRLIDVSSIKELARRWYPKAYFNSPEKTGNPGHWLTLESPSQSCATTARPSWSPPPVLTERKQKRSQPTTLWNTTNPSLDSAG